MILLSIRNREQAEETAYARKQQAAQLAKLREQLAKTEEEKVRKRSRLYSLIAKDADRALFFAFRRPDSTNKSRNWKPSNKSDKVSVKDGGTVIGQARDMSK